MTTLISAYWVSTFLFGAGIGSAVTSYFWYRVCGSVRDAWLADLTRLTDKLIAKGRE